MDLKQNSVQYGIMVLAMPNHQVKYQSLRWDSFSSICKFSVMQTHNIGGRLHGYKH
jgi:hypothetical protein